MAKDNADIAPRATALSEDRRQPKSPGVYILLWITCVVCVIFACVALLNPF
jgi:hypothetical protein